MLSGCAAMGRTVVAVLVEVAPSDEGMNDGRLYMTGLVEVGASCVMTESVIEIAIGTGTGRKTVIEIATERGIGIGTETATGIGRANVTGSASANGFASANGCECVIVTGTVAGPSLDGGRLNDWVDLKTANTTLDDNRYKD